MTAKQANTQIKKKRGRKSSYTPELGDEICLRLLTRKGKKLRSQRDICKDQDMPCEDTVYRWLSKHNEFSEKYARTREIRAHLLADEVIEIADTEKDPQIARNRIEARKWWAGKVAAKYYGDRIEVNQTLGVSEEFEGLIRELKRTPRLKVIESQVTDIEPGE